jgi:Protein of unknown function (DUF2867)
LIASVASTRHPVRRIEVPAQARALCTLERIDYEDAFVVEVDAVEIHTAEQWARAILDDAPPLLRAALRSGWSAIGLRLGPTRGDGFVLGWEVRRSDPEFVLLGACSHLGLPAELLVMRLGEELLFDTFVRHDGVLARAVWAGTEPLHKPIVRYVLGTAAGRHTRR